MLAERVRSAGGRAVRSREFVLSFVKVGVRIGHRLVVVLARPEDVVPVVGSEDRASDANLGDQQDSCRARSGIVGCRQLVPIAVPWVPSSGVS